MRRPLPDKSARILIYCNNNFSGAEGAFPSKLPSASLNLSTYVALYDYGYRNVYELGPLIDVGTAAIATRTLTRRLAKACASTGAPSILASYKPLSRWIAPGPDVARHTPTWPVNFA